MSSDRIRNEQVRPIRVRPSKCDDSLAATKRMQAMVLTLQRYAFTVKLKPGKEQVIADLLSRYTGNCEQPVEAAAREHVFQVQQHETMCRQFEMIDPVRDCPVTNTLYTCHDQGGDRT